MLSDRLRFLFLGLPTWALVNALWASLSGVAEAAPEGFAVSAYLILCLSAGHLLPLALNAREKLGRGGQRDWHLLSLLLQIESLSFVAGVAMCLYWRRTVTLGRRAVSLPMFLCVLIFGACSAAANVLKFMLAGRQRGDASSSGSSSSRSCRADVCTASLSSGMALGAMAAGALGIVRGTAFQSNANSVSIFIFVMALTHVPSILLLLGMARPQPPGSSSSSSSSSGPNVGDHDQEEDAVMGTTKHLNIQANESSGLLGNSKVAYRYVDPPRIPLLARLLLLRPPDVQLLLQSSEAAVASGHQQQRGVETSASVPVWGSLGSLLWRQLLHAALGFGLMPAMISTACGRFGDASSTILLLVTGLSCLIDPLGRALTECFRIRTPSHLRASSALLSMLGLGAAVLAFGPQPSDAPLMATVGKALPFIIFVSFGPAFGFITTCIFMVSRECGDACTTSSSVELGEIGSLAKGQEQQQVEDKEAKGEWRDATHESPAEAAVRLCGVVTQAGAMVGSLLGFALVVMVA